MKKVLLVIVAVINISIANAQTVSVKEAMSFIGQGKDLVLKKVRAIGYIYKGMDLDSYKFSKNLSYATSDLTLSFESNRCAAMSWTVSVLHASNTMGDVLRNGFQVNEEATSGYVQAFKHFAKGLVLVLFDRSAYNNTILVTLGSMAQNELSSQEAEMDTKRSTAPKAKFSGFSPEKKGTTSLFQETKTFCDEDDDWSYEVTIKGDSITLRLYPGKNNDYHKDKTKPRETVKGRIVEGFIITKDAPAYLKNRFRFEDGRLFKMNNEGEYNEFDECQ